MNTVRCLRIYRRAWTNLYIAIAVPRRSMDHQIYQGIILAFAND